MKIARITKIAGISLAGFVVATYAADKANVGPALAQIAGFAGGVLGSLVAKRRTSSTTNPEHTNAAEQPTGPKPTA